MQLFWHLTQFHVSEAFGSTSAAIQHNAYVASKKKYENFNAKWTIAQMKDYEIIA